MALAPLYETRAKISAFRRGIVCEENRILGDCGRKDGRSAAFGAYREGFKIVKWICGRQRLRNEGEKIQNQARSLRKEEMEAKSRRRCNA